jgi:hypothetical protein
MCQLLTFMCQLLTFMCQLYWTSCIHEQLTVVLLRLLALQIVQGSNDRAAIRPSYGQAAGGDGRTSPGGSSTAGIVIGAHVRVAREDLSAALGRMKTG